MCLMAFAIHPCPQVGLLLAANRDEALDRPTLPLHRWHTPAGTEVVGGRDERDGGTWLACTGPGAPHASAGRVAMLTNVRHGRDTTRWPRSRGALPLTWLDGTTLDDLINQLDPAAYGAFNLVVGELATGQWHWLTNRDAQHHVTLACQALPPGVYGLSNAGLDTPWPKTVALRHALQTALPAWTAGVQNNDPNGTQAEDAMWAALASRHMSPDSRLPHTGVPLDWERALSAIWVDHPAAQDTPDAPTSAGYGTRTSALMTVARGVGACEATAWHWHVQEHTWRPPALQGRRVEKWVTGK